MTIGSRPVLIDKGFVSSTLRMLFVVEAFLLMLFNSACQEVPKLTDYRVISDMTGYQSWVDSVPIIVVATIREDVPVARPVKSHWDPDVELQLHRLSIHVENMLRGNLKLSTIPVYYFKIASSYDGNPPLGSWRGGKRNLFYIRPDAGVLRLACDLKNHCTSPVRTGAHPKLKADPSQPLDAILAEIFFTKGEDVSDIAFADAIGEQGRALPGKYAIPKLKVLALSTNPDIQNAACFALKDNFNLPCETPTPRAKN